jgi:hypothetical protein
MERDWRTVVETKCGETWVHWCPAEVGDAQDVQFVEAYQKLLGDVFEI